MRDNAPFFARMGLHPSYVFCRGAKRANKNEQYRVMFLEVENKPSRNVENFEVIEKELRKLKSYGPSSFAILTNADGDFIQVAGGRVTCVVELKIRSTTSHRRAYLQSKWVPFEGTQVLMFGAGHMSMQPEECLFIDDVIGLFEAFFNAAALPEHILWRSIE